MKKKIEHHVQQLFAHYPKTNENIELQEEVRGNLLEKYNDLIVEGVSEKEAYQRVKQSLPTVAPFVGNEQTVYLYPFLVQGMQWTLIIALITWILTIPLHLFYGPFLNLFVLAIVGVIAILYLLSFVFYKKSPEQTVSLRIISLNKSVKFVWIVSLMIIMVYVFMEVGVRIASPIWFSYSINFSGPYEFTQWLIPMILPFLWIGLPLSFQKFVKSANDHMKEEESA